jgi:hypothetical protein
LTAWDGGSIPPGSIFFRYARAVRRVYTLQSIESYLARRNAPCPRCGYNLRGLSKGRCPECGFGFDVESLKALSTPRPLIIEWTIDHALWGVVALVCLNQGVAIFMLPLGEVRVLRLLSLGIIAALVLSHLYRDLRLDDKGFAFVDGAVRVCACTAAAQTLLLLEFLVL